MYYLENKGDHNIIFALTHYARDINAGLLYIQTFFTFYSTNIRNNHIALTTGIHTNISFVHSIQVKNNYSITGVFLSENLHY